MRVHELAQFCVMISFDKGNNFRKAINQETGGIPIGPCKPKSESRIPACLKNESQKIALKFESKKLKFESRILPCLKFDSRIPGPFEI